MTTTALTAGEQRMLTAVISLMGDVPDIDYNLLAEAVGQKYARNARTGCKKLFEKLRASNGVAPANTGTDTGAGASLKKATAKKVTKKVATPRKGVKKNIKEEVKEESEDEHAEDIDMDEEVDGDEGPNGKSNPPRRSARKQAQDSNKMLAECKATFFDQLYTANDFNMIGLNEYEAEYPYPCVPGGGLASFERGAEHLKRFFKWKKTHCS